MLLILLCLGTGLVLCGGRASAETRTLRIYHVHTGEKAVIVYKRNGHYVEAGLKKLDYILRDWRKDKEIDMDPRLMDLLWEVYQKSGSQDYIHIICGYRTGDTNAMLRGRSRVSGVAKKSQHILGKAVDFYIPDVQLEKLREIGMKFQVGGVGYYPSSGSPFVHMDTGFVRAWPRMTREQLVRLFPNGRTLHLPRDGKPLPGYEEALASYRRRVSDDSILVAGGGSVRSRPGGRNLLAALFGGGGGDEDEGGLDAGNTVQASAKLRNVETAAMAPVDAGPPVAEPAVLLPTASKVPLPGIRPMAVADATSPRAQSVALQAAGQGSSAAGGEEPTGEGPTKYADLLAYAAPVPQLPPWTDSGGSLSATSGVQEATARLAAEATGTVPASSGRTMPMPGLRPELVAYAPAAGKPPAPSPAAIAGPRRRVSGAADIVARAKRKLTKGAILMASLGPVPVVRPYVLSRSRPPQHFASVPGKEIRGARIGAGKTTRSEGESRLTPALLEAWGRAHSRGRLVADSAPAPRMSRLSRVARGQDGRGPHAVDPQRFAAIPTGFRSE